jgi:plasmid stabilization system protein ParE
MASLELLVVAQVNVDLTEQANFIANDNLDAALRFLDNAAATFEFLAEHPDVGTL